MLRLCAGGPAVNPGDSAPAGANGGCFHEWVFGDGMGYVDFAYSHLTIDGPRTQAGAIALASAEEGSVVVSLRVTNTGTVDGQPTLFTSAKHTKHTILFFLTDEYRTITPEVKMLKHFEKIELAPGASTTVTWTVAANDLMFWGKDLSIGRVAEPGTFTVRVGSGPDCEAGCEAGCGIGEDEAGEATNTVACSQFTLV